MTESQFESALEVGRDMVEQGLARDMQLFIGGEMGIGNTTAAAAIGCSLLGVKASDMAGPGTGLDASGVSHKAQVIERALELHADALTSPRLYSESWVDLKSRRLPAVIFAVPRPAYPFWWMDLSAPVRHCVRQDYARDVKIG
jgi:hypothetical protein